MTDAEEKELLEALFGNEDERCRCPDCESWAPPQR
jgi:hypothetical protein